MRTSRPLVFRSVILVLLVKGAGSLTNQYHVLVEYKVLACTLVVDGAYSTVLVPGIILVYVVYCILIIKPPAAPGKTTSILGNLIRGIYPGGAIKMIFGIYMHAEDS